MILLEILIKTKKNQTMIQGSKFGVMYKLSMCFEMRRKKIVSATRSRREIVGKQMDERCLRFNVEQSKDHWNRRHFTSGKTANIIFFFPWPNSR